MFRLTWDEEKELHHKLAISFFGTSVPVFLLLYFVIDAPWGKHLPSNGKTKWLLGPSINSRVSWVLFESPNLIWSIYCYQHRKKELFGPANAVLLALFFGHYINRTIIYPMLLSTNSKPMPLAVVLAGFTFTNFNGYLQAQNLCHFRQYPPKYYQSPNFLFGCAMFFLGFGINLQSDSILRGLRKSSTGGYQIPRGGVFEYCSGANYTGEILEWTGYAIANNNSLAAWAFLIYTVSNLIPRAVSHHRWYQATFKDYPRDRKAVIPFLW